MTTGHPTVAASRVRPAKPADALPLHDLIRHYSEQGILLPRTLEDLRKTIGNFRVISSDGKVLACAALQPYTPTAAELRSLAVTPELRGTGLGRNLVQAVLEEAFSRNLEMVFAFTYATEFFSGLGFVPIDRSLVPWKAWKDCLFCPKRDCCDEVAVAYWLKRPAAKKPAAKFPIWINHKIW